MAAQSPECHMTRVGDKHGDLDVRLRCEKDNLVDHGFESLDEGGRHSAKCCPDRMPRLTSLEHGR